MGKKATKKKTSWIKINTLNLLKYNPNVMQETELEKLEKSIVDFSDIIPKWDALEGYRLPIKIVVNDHNNVVIDGNHRIKALVAMGFDRKFSTTINDENNCRNNS